VSPTYMHRQFADASFSPVTILTPPLQQPGGLAPASRVGHCPGSLLAAAPRSFTCGCCKCVLLLKLQSTPRPVTRASSTGAGSSSQVYCQRLPVLMRAMVVSCVRWSLEVLIGWQAQEHGTDTGTDTEASKGQAQTWQVSDQRWGVSSMIGGCTRVLCMAGMSEMCTAG
jgi:hypothetical protein